MRKVNVVYSSMTLRSWIHAAMKLHGYNKIRAARVTTTASIGKIQGLEQSIDHIRFVARRFICIPGGAITLSMERGVTTGT